MEERHANLTDDGRRRRGRRQEDVYKRQVQRIQQLDFGQTPLFAYGCSFDQITERQEDRLFQDLFALQVKAVNRK